MRYFLPLYLLAYFIAAFFWRSYVIWKKTGVNPVVFKGSDSAHDFNIWTMWQVEIAIFLAAN